MCNGSREERECGVGVGEGERSCQFFFSLSGVTLNIFPLLTITFRQLYYE